MKLLIVRIRIGVFANDRQGCVISLLKLSRGEAISRVAGAEGERWSFSRTGDSVRPIDCEPEVRLVMKRMVR